MSSFYISVTSPTSQLILQPFRRFTYVTAHFQPFRYFTYSPPLWARRQHARLSRSGSGFEPRSGQVSWGRFFRGLSSPVRQMSGSFRPPRSPNIIWPSLSSSLIIHYGRQWPEMMTRPKTLNKHMHMLHLRHNSFSNPSFAFPTSQALHLRRLASRPWLESWFY